MTWTRFPEILRAAVVLTVIFGLVEAAAIEELVRVDLPRITADDEVEIEADLLTYERAGRRAVAAGDARLHVDGIRLRADQIALDLELGFAKAVGDVRLEHGARRLMATSLTFAIDDERVIASDVVLEVIDPRTGRQRLQLGALRLERLGTGILLAQRLEFTTCDCPGDAPASWSLSARSARVNPDRGAWLLGAALRVRGRRVIVLPAFYLPLGERRSGILAPRFGFSGQNGLRLALPYYQVLGESWDLTFTAGWYQGRDTLSGEVPTRPGVRGPDQALELRWTPSTGTRGYLVLTHLYDLHPDSTAPAAPSRGSRLTLRSMHTSRLDDGAFGWAGTGLHANLNLVSDAALVADLQPTLEQAQRGYLRSAIRAHVTPSDRWSVEAGGRWLQDITRRLTVGDDGLPTRTPMFGDASPDTPQLLPAVSAVFLPTAIARQASVRGELRASSWQRAGSDGPGDGVFHLRSELELSHPIVAGEALGGRIAGAVAGDTWAAPTTGTTAVRAYPRLDASLYTGLQRRLGDVTHRVWPQVSYRLVPILLGDGHDSVLDVYDVAVSPSGLHQIVGSMRSELWSGGRTHLDSSVSQGFDIRLGRPSDLEALLILSPAPASRALEARGAWSWDARTLSWASLAGRVTGEAGASMSLRWLWADTVETSRFAAGLDELFASGAMRGDLIADPARPINEAVLILRAPRVRGLSLGYDVSLDLAAEARPPQHRIRADYLSRCRCWSANVSAVWPPGRRLPEVLVGLELTGLGSAATRPGGF